MLLTNPQECKLVDKYSSEDVANAICYTPSLEVEEINSGIKGSISKSRKGDVTNGKSREFNASLVAWRNYQAAVSTTRSTNGEHKDIRSGSKFTRSKVQRVVLQSVNGETLKYFADPVFPDLRNIDYTTNSTQLNLPLFKVGL